jgi:hypothetical protein
MKLPSIRLALQDARDTFLRFPIVVLDAIVGTTAALILVDHEGPPQPTLLFRVLFATALGLLLLLSLALHSERKRHGRWATFGFQCAGVLLLVAYAFTVPLELMHAPHLVTFRFLLLGTALGLLAMIVPSAGGGTENGFWQFNRRLLVRVITTGLYSVVLFAGFALAMAALDNLFNVTVPPRRYGELWVVILGLFCPWFFLAGVPKNRTPLESQIDYPKELKAFALYILSPIVLVYLVILYAYLAKILLAWDWPKGWVSGLILGFASSGIVLTLILKPLAEREGMSWISRAIMWFHAVMVPLIVMLFLAFWRRVSEYGITEPRYLGFALVAWLTILVIYYFISRKRSLRFIPLSLCIGAFAISFGPWGMFSVSESSQIARLKHMVTTAGILNDGKVTQTHPAVPFEDAKEISAVLNYLRENHGFGGIQSWFTEDLRADSSAMSTQFKSTPAVTELMGLKYVEPWAGSGDGNVTLQAEGAFRLSGYEHMVKLPEFAAQKALADSVANAIAFSMAEGMNRILFTNKATGAEILHVDLQAHADALLRKYGATSTGRLADSLMTIRAESSQLSVCVCPWNIVVFRHDSTSRVIRMDAVLLYTVKKPL